MDVQVNIKAFYLPWAMLVVGMLFGNPASALLSDLTGNTHSEIADEVNGHLLRNCCGTPLLLSEDDLSVTDRAVLVEVSLVAVTIHGQVLQNQSTDARHRHPIQDSKEELNDVLQEGKQPRATQAADFRLSEEQLVDSQTDTFCNHPFNCPVMVSVSTF